MWICCLCFRYVSETGKGGGGKGGEINIKVVGNAWEGFKKMWMECGSDECDVWMPIKAPGGWSGKNDEFRCGVCMVKEMMKLIRPIIVEF